MAKAVICPICQGLGTVRIVNGEKSTEAATQSRICHGCGGKGWVEVSENNTERREAMKINDVAAIFKYLENKKGKVILDLEGLEPKALVFDVEMLKAKIVGSSFLMLTLPPDKDIEFISIDKIIRVKFLPPRD